MKICKTCGESKPITDYFVSRTCIGGRLHHCKVCTRIKTTKAYRFMCDNPDVYAEHNFSRGKYIEKNSKYTQKSVWQYIKRKIERDPTVLPYAEMTRDELDEIIAEMKARPITVTAKGSFKRGQKTK